MKILVGYDGTVPSKDALVIAKMHAQAFQAELEIVTSMVSTHSQEDIASVEQAKNQLKDAKNFFDQFGIPCNTHLLIRGYSPGEDIIKFAEENEVSEIIVGVEKKSKMEKLVMGSTAQYVILKASCPVVSVKL